MSPQIFFIVGIICVGIALVGGILWWHNTKGTFLDTDTVRISFPHGIITAEIAASPAKQSRGLSGRAELPSLYGMLFTFSSPQKQTFWMKGMKMSLDFIWISDKKVIETRSDVPPPQNLLDVTLIAPVQPADLVLEVAAGTIQMLQIKAGDVVEISDAK